MSMDNTNANGDGKPSEHMAVKTEQNLTGGSNQPNVAPSTGSSPATTSNSGNAASTSTSTGNAVPFNMNRLVMEYLTRKGYHQTEATLRAESTRIPGPQTFNLNNSNSNFTTPTVATSNRTNLQFQHQQFIVKQNLDKSTQFDKDPKMFGRAYTLYRSWCENSLEMYKFELEKLLYPFFVHLFLNLIQRNDTEEAQNFILKFKSDHMLSHSEEIKNLISLNSADHLTENKYANLFLNNKYKLNLSNTSLNLILSFLNENQAIGGGILVRILNNSFEFHTQTEVTNQNTVNDTINLEGIPEIYQLINLGSDHDNEKFKTSKTEFLSQNEKPLKLGPYPNDEEFTKELEAELKHKDNIAKEKEKESNTVSNRKTLMEEYTENFKIDPKNDDSPARDTLPLPQKSVYDLKRAIQEIQDSRLRIKLTTSSYSHQTQQQTGQQQGQQQKSVFISQPALPSVCMYTFHNTNNDLTTLEYHPDATMIAGGFQDSFIKLWSIDGSPLKSILKNDPYNEESFDAGNHLPTNMSRKLIGHSGAVYGLSFSPDGNYLLSSSADSTVRLWSMDTYTSLVSYKGHGGAGGSGGANSPVWDVEFSPLGHYFATASHDQTARLWSCDHIYPLRIFAGHLNDVDIVRFHPNGTYLFTGSSDKTIRMWDVARAESVRVFIGHTSPISDIACSPDGRWLASASVNEENYLSTSFGFNDINRSSKLNDSSDKDDKLKDKLGDGGNLSANDKSNSSTSGSGSHNNKSTSTTFTGSVIYIWDISSGRKLKTLRGHGSGGIHSLTWSKGGEVLVSGGADGSVRVWDVKKGTADSTSGTQPERFIPTTNVSSSGLNDSNSKHSTHQNKNTIVSNYGSNDHMAVYFTKKTPVYKVQFTRRNLCLAAGPFMG